ncbi:ClpXP protease specificity-enhancing factor [Sulfurirhabdus autotrophica]|uniref:Stringent starvation protein B n=1 Tax=Sulfurirhabdus autotrophica TaxID=1706046 RepID=A0A4R3XXE3_9PROT|nr:ClpXP protease specificity-enhancing factor [Sulfurirhabdus autotrophica]TCV83732.1 stringent starvation protein B [Sulfurirhabdus autotrophica]
MADISTKPYIIRAIYEWCSDSGLTPYLAVAVDSQTRVPMEFVKDGEIVLNLSLSATNNLTMGNDAIQFSARFSGASRELYVPVKAVIGIFSRENGQGMFFPKEPEGVKEIVGVVADVDAQQKPASKVEDKLPQKPVVKKSHLKLIK